MRDFQHPEMVRNGTQLASDGLRCVWDKTCMVNYFEGMSELLVAMWLGRVSKIKIHPAGGESHGGSKQENTDSTGGFSGPKWCIGHNKTKI